MNKLDKIHLAGTVVVYVKDLISVLNAADSSVRWSNEDWDARCRLLNAVESCKENV